MDVSHAEELVGKLFAEPIRGSDCQNRMMPWFDGDGSGHGACVAALWRKRANVIRRQQRHHEAVRQQDPAQAFILWPCHVERVDTVGRCRLGRRGDRSRLRMDLVPRLGGSHICADVGGDEHAGGAGHRSNGKAQCAEQHVSEGKPSDNG